jgi:malate dehydrogenase
LIRCSFAEKILRAVSGESGIVEPSYVYLPGVPGGEEIAKETGCDFFSVPIELGVSLLYFRFLKTTNNEQPNGAEKAFNVLTDANDVEKTLLKACISGLKDNIEKGITFAHNPPQK